MLTTIRKLYDLFERRERWQSLALFGTMLATAVIQALSVVSILPFVVLVARPGMIRENERIRWVYDTLGFTDPGHFLIFVGVGVLTVIAASNAIGALSTWLTLRFSWNKSCALEKRLLAKYLDEPYAFHLDHNSSKLTKTMFAEVQAVVKGVLVPLLRMVSQGAVVVLMLTTLLIVDPMLALAAALVLGGGYSLVYAMIRRGQARRGSERVEAGRRRYKVAGEAFGGIKDVKLLGREQTFLNKYGRAAGRYARANASNAMASELPKYLIETVVFGGLIAIVLYLLASRGDLRDVLPVITLFAVAGQRMKPALKVVFGSLAKIRFHEPSLNVLHTDLIAGALPAEPVFSAAHGGATPAPVLRRDLVVRDLSFRYPASSEPVLRNVNLRIPHNSTVGFVGGTGSGKTTLVDILLGLLHVHEGSVEVDGVPITTTNVRGWQRSIGYVPQHIFLCDDSVTANIAFGVPADEVDHRAVERAAQIANIHDFVIGDLPKGYATVVGERGVRLSGGQRQRIGIARALYTDPDILIMDEATSALDNMTETAVMQAISALAGRKTIILVAHRLTTVESCDCIFLFEQGEIVTSGTFRELVEGSAKFRTMARVDTPLTVAT
jgi:ATP-binding cassette, subfamily B, bacterial PglK